AIDRAPACKDPEVRKNQSIVELRLQRKMAANKRESIRARRSVTRYVCGAGVICDYYACCRAVICGYVRNGRPLYGPFVARGCLGERLSFYGTIRHFTCR